MYIIYVYYICILHKCKEKVIIEIEIIIKNNSFQRKFLQQCYLGVFKS